MRTRSYRIWKSLVPHSEIQPPGLAARSLTVELSPEKWVTGLLLWRLLTFLFFCIRKVEENVIYKNTSAFPLPSGLLSTGHLVRTVREAARLN